VTFGRFRWIAVVALLIPAVGVRGQAQAGRGESGFRLDDHRVIYTGLINDHTLPAAGAWEVHGVWTMDVRERFGRADFSAALTMERADYWFLTNPNPPADPNSLAARNPHTHHVTMTDVLVTTLTNGFRLSGPATLTGNGATPPFGTSSTAQVDITGGNLVTNSNIALTFGGDAVKHFGPDPFSGVVSGMKKIDWN
jgi:hypothetical protein